MVLTLRVQILLKQCDCFWVLVGFMNYHIELAFLYLSMQNSKGIEEKARGLEIESVCFFLPFLVLVFSLI